MTDYMATHEHFIATYGAKYADKIAHLRRRITESQTGEDTFLVLPFEAGLGKSVQSDRIIGEYIRDGGGRRFLVVKKFIADVDNSVHRINEIASVGLESELPLVDRFPAALGITKNNWRYYRTNLADLQDFQVVVVTDQRYLRLCRDVSTRGFFTAGRHTLIIDEALPIPIATFSESEYRAAQNLLPIALQDDLAAVCKALFGELTAQAELQRQSGNQILRCRPTMDMDALVAFKKLVEANLDSITDHTKIDSLMKFVDNLFTELS